MSMDSAMSVRFAVALLAEGVDRNFTIWPVRVSSRVALLAEGVDRNPNKLPKRRFCTCRPPRGGRG